MCIGEPAFLSEEFMNASKADPNIELVSTSGNFFIFTTFSKVSNLSFYIKDTAKTVLCAFFNKLLSHRYSYQISNNIL